MTTLERFDKWKNPTRPADDKIRVWQHQTSFFIIVQSNKIHVYQITWYKVEQQLYNRMISQFSIYTLILGIFDWNIYILSGTTDLVLATNIDREICHTINSRQLCLMADVSIYTNYLMKVYIRFRRSAGCVSCDVILNSNIDKSYCKYKLIGTLLCFLQMST